MKYLKPIYLPFLIVVITLTCSFVFAKTNTWQLAHHHKNVWVWNLTSQKDVIGTLQTSTRSKPVNLKNIQTKNFFKKFKNSRQKTLKMIGITRWTASDYKWKKKSDHYELTLNGTYRNAQNQLIRFYETHLFYQQKTHQILFSHPSKTSINRNIASQFVTKTKKMVSQ